MYSTIPGYRSASAASSVATRVPFPVQEIDADDCVINTTHKEIERLYLERRTSDDSRQQEFSDPGCPYDLLPGASDDTTRTCHNIQHSPREASVPRPQFVDLSDFDWIEARSLAEEDEHILYDLPSQQARSFSIGHCHSRERLRTQRLSSSISDESSSSRQSLRLAASSCLSLSHSPLTTPEASIAHDAILSAKRPRATFPVDDRSTSPVPMVSLLGVRDRERPDPCVLGRLDELDTAVLDDDSASDGNEDARSDASTINDSHLGFVSDAPSMVGSQASVAEVLRALGQGITRPRSVSDASVFSSALASGKSIKLQHGSHNESPSARQEGSSLPGYMVDWPTYREVYVKEPRYTPALPIPVSKDTPIPPTATIKGKQTARQVPLGRQAMQQRFEAGSEIELLRRRARTKSDAGFLNTFAGLSDKLKKSWATKPSYPPASSAARASSSRLALFGFRKDASDA